MSDRPDGNARPNPVNSVEGRGSRRGSPHGKEPFSQRQTEAGTRRQPAAPSALADDCAIATAR